MKTRSFEKCLRFFRRVAAIGNHDFCPWANRYVYWLKQPIGWFLVGALASLLIGLFLAPQGFVMLAAIAAVIVMGVAWPWIGMRGVTCRLRFDRPRTRENDSVRVTLAFTNRWPWPAWGLAVEGGFFAEENPSDDSTAVALARVAGWSESDFLGVRPYRQGDLLRHVHWAQTARRDSFVVCERQSTARRTVRVTMDVDPGVHRGDRIDGSLEWTIRVGASICQEFLVPGLGHAHAVRRVQRTLWRTGEEAETAACRLAIERECP